MKNGEIMKTGIKIAMMSLLTFSLVGCNDFLDTTPHDSISDKVVWNDIHTATLYLNGFIRILTVTDSSAPPSFKVI
jgi:hypothetical protein